MHTEAHDWTRKAAAAAAAKPAHEQTADDKIAIEAGRHLERGLANRAAGDKIVPIR